MATTMIPSFPQVEYLVRELASARAEATALRNNLSKPVRYSTIIKRAIADGHELMMDAFSEQPTGRNTKREQGMSIRRWRWAVAFLKYAGVIAMKPANWRDGLQWIVADLDQSVALIERAARELSTTNGYKRLKVVARHRR